MLIALKQYDTSEIIAEEFKEEEEPLIEQESKTLNNFVMKKK